MNRLSTMPSATNPQQKATARLTLAVALTLAACGSEAALTNEADIASKQLALTCSGSGCDKQDPEATGCAADATTLASQSHIDGGQIELRWSKACGTKWARVTRAHLYQTSAWLEETPYSFMTTMVPGSWDGQDATLMWGNMSYSAGYYLSACTYITNCRGGCDTFIDYKCTAMAKEP